MTTRRLALRALCAGRVCLITRVTRESIQPLGAIRFSSTGPATVADAAFWRSLIPKPLRKENRNKSKGGKSKEWNPATFFIIMFLVIGSMSIQMIALRHESERYNRQSTVRIGQLREALRKIQNGEEVDVDKLLRSVDQVQRDAAWEESTYHNVKDGIPNNMYLPSTNRGLAVLKALESDEHSRTIYQEAKQTTRPEAQKKAAARKPQMTKDVEVDECVGAESSPTTKPKPANLGNFF